MNARDNSITRFDANFDKYMWYIRNNSYLFEVTKFCGCCEYCEMIPIQKNATCAELYKNIIHHFQLQPENQIRIYITASESVTPVKDNVDKMFIKNDDKSIRDLIMENSSYFKPIYPLPVVVVYNLICDDGHQYSC